MFKFVFWVSFFLNIIGVFVILKMPGHFESNNSLCVCKGASGIMSQLSAIGSCKCKRVEVIDLVSLLSFSLCSVHSHRAWAGVSVFALQRGQMSVGNAAGLSLLSLDPDGSVLLLV